MEGRDLAISLAGGRVAIGVVLLLAPGFVGRTMTGRGGSDGGTRLFARMVGARDLGLGLGLLVALNRGAPVRGWLEASAVVDGIDATACLLARDHIRTSVLPGAFAWRAPERCSAPGWHGSSTRRGLHRQERGDDGRPAPPTPTCVPVARRPPPSSAEPQHRPGATSPGSTAHLGGVIDSRM